VKRHTAPVLFPTHTHTHTHTHTQLIEAAEETELADLLSAGPRSSSELFVVSQLLSWLESGFYNDTCLHPFIFIGTRDVIQTSLAFSDYHRLLFSADDKSPYLPGMSLACALPSGELAVVTQNLHTFVSVSWLAELKRLSPSRHGISGSETAGCPETV